MFLIRLLAKIGWGLVTGSRVISGEMAQLNKVKQGIEKGIAMIEEENAAAAAAVARVQSKIDQNLDMAKSALNMIDGIRQKMTADEAPSSPWPREGGA